MWKIKFKISSVQRFSMSSKISDQLLLKPCTKMFLLKPCRKNAFTETNPTADDRHISSLPTSSQLDTCRCCSGIPIYGHIARWWCKLRWLGLKIFQQFANFTKNFKLVKNPTSYVTENRLLYYGGSKLDTKHNYFRGVQCSWITLIIFF